MIHLKSHVCQEPQAARMGAGPQDWKLFAESQGLAAASQDQAAASEGSALPEAASSDSALSALHEDAPNADDDSVSETTTERFLIMDPKATPSASPSASLDLPTSQGSSGTGAVIENGWLAQAPQDERVGKRPSTMPPAAAQPESTKPAWIAKVGVFFASLDPSKRSEESSVSPQAAAQPGGVGDDGGEGGSNDGEASADGEDSDDQEDEDEEEEDDEEAGGGEEEEEAEAEQRVRALLFSALATKRVDGDPVKMDILVEPDVPIKTDQDPSYLSTEHKVMGQQAQQEPRPLLRQNQHQSQLVCRVAVFNDEQLGMVLSKGRKGEAVVATLTQGSAASQAGVLVGDTVVGVNAARSSDFNQVLWLLRNVERPMHLLLLGKRD